MGWGTVTSPYGVKDLIQGPVRWRVVSLGGFASESIIGVQGARSTGFVPVQEVAQGQPLRSP